MLKSQLYVRILKKKKKKYIYIKEKNIWKVVWDNRKYIRVSATGCWHSVPVVVQSLSRVQTLCKPMGLQHAKLPSPSLCPRVCSNSCSLSQRWLTVTSSSTLFFCLQSFPASGSFPLSQLFTSGGQSIGVSASTLVLPINSQGFFLLGLTSLIPLLWKGLSRVFSSTTIQKHQFGAQPSLWFNSHIHTWLLEKPQLWAYGPLSAKWCLCFLIRCLDLSQLFFQGVSVF